MLSVIQTFPVKRNIHTKYKIYLLVMVIIATDKSKTSIGSILGLSLAPKSSIRCYRFQNIFPISKVLINVSLKFSGYIHFTPKSKMK